GIIFHTDAVQAMCHVPINVRDMNIDLLSASAHKFNGPKGVGFMYMNNRCKLEPFIHGGSQERARRAGTSNVPGIVGMGSAALSVSRDYETISSEITALRNYMVNRIMQEIPDTTFDGPSTGDVRRLPGNMHFCFKGVSGDSLLIMLDMKGICASSGSACAAGSIDPSHVLTAIGRNAEESKGALRLSISADTTKEEADYVIDTLKSVVERLRG
ncbi:MAG: aminotransferase class V-fold PLP-dependent enzyme, partial [Lachnospira sp.]|nr:aminotransferase class V-fold PLP-dependent enzyme [Lachnospira sp.]